MDGLGAAIKARPPVTTSARRVPAPPTGILLNYSEKTDAYPGRETSNAAGTAKFFGGFVLGAYAGKRAAEREPIRT